ncbi:hypothetical protein AB5J72_29930 [Streptomyces sp. CG1]|uniref:hypothetical protein n=1 Tax=Streptomyces sp. CG1 TaxID=1287523 RepID=UPI0034E2B896
MPATGPTGISMHDLLAACAAAETISRPPEHPEREQREGARDCAESAANPPQTADDRSTRPHPRAAA